MGYITDWALVVGKEVRDNFFRRAKESSNDFVMSALRTADKILEHENGDLLFISDMKGGMNSLASEIQEIMEEFDEEGEYWLLRTIGEDQGECEDWGAYWDNPFAVCIQRSWWIDEDKTKKLEDVPIRNAITAMKEAVDGRK